MKILMFGFDNEEIATNIGLILNECGASAVDVKPSESFIKDLNENSFDIVKRVIFKFNIIACFVYNEDDCIEKFKHHKYIIDNNINIADIMYKDLRVRFYKAASDTITKY
jgi:hypothetical protein